MSAQPQPVPLPDPESLRRLVRGELERSQAPDPLSLTSRVLTLISDEDFDAAARYGIGRILSEEARHLRRRSMRLPDTPPRSAKWQGAAQAAKARPDIFAARVVVAVDEHGQDAYAFLGDCTKKMLREAARLLRERGDTAKAAAYGQADRYLALGRKLRGSALVRSLPKSVVAQVLDQ